MRLKEFIANKSIMFYGFLVAVHVYVTSYSVLLELAERAYVAGILGFIGVLVLLNLLLGTVKKTGFVFYSTCIVFNVLFFMWQPLLGYKFVGIYFLSDFLLISAVILSAMLFSSLSNEKVIEKLFYTMLFVGFVAYLLALLHYLGSDIKRFQSPPVILVSLSIYVFFTTHSVILKKIAFLIMVSLLVLSLLSGERTNFVITCVAIFVLFISLGSDKRGRKIFKLLFIVLLLLIGGFLSLDYIANETRFKSVSGGEIDISLLSRFIEAKDAIGYMFSIDNVFVYLLGFGHGGVYEVNEYIGSDLNLVDGIYSHHIHITPVLFFFRYGLLGFLLYLYLIFLVLKRLKSVFFRKCHPHYKVIVTVVFLFLIDSLFRNVLVSPFFIFFFSMFVSNVGVYKNA